MSLRSSSNSLTTFIFTRVMRRFSLRHQAGLEIFIVLRPFNLCCTIPKRRGHEDTALFTACHAEMAFLPLTGFACSFKSLAFAAAAVQKSGNQDRALGGTSGRRYCVLVAGHGYSRCTCNRTSHLISPRSSIADPGLANQLFGR